MSRSSFLSQSLSLSPLHSLSAPSFSLSVFLIFLSLPIFLVVLTPISLFQFYTIECSLPPLSLSLCQSFANVFTIGAFQSRESCMGQKQFCIKTREWTFTLVRWALVSQFNSVNSSSALLIILFGNTCCSKM